MPKNSYSKIHSNANCKSLSIFFSQRMCYILLPKLLLLVFFREKEGCQEMLLWVQIRNLLFFLLVNLLFKKGTLLKTTILILAMFDKNVFRFDNLIKKYSSHEVGILFISMIVKNPREQS